MDMTTRQKGVFPVLILALGLMIAGLAAPLRDAAAESTAGAAPAFKVFNKTSTEVSVRMKFWSKSWQPIRIDEHLAITMPDGQRSVQLEAKSRKQWDTCWVNAYPDACVVVIDGNERIACTVEPGSSCNSAGNAATGGSSGGGFMDKVKGWLKF